MRIEHSSLMNEFISFWFETFVDGELRYETFVDYMGSEWYTCPAGVDDQILLRGDFSSSLPDDAVPDSIKPKIEAAIRDGRI
jgi:hypothetical protein